MEPDINQKRAFVQQEFARRQAGLGASSAGLGDTNVPNPSLPNPSPSTVQGGAEGFASDGAVSKMKQEKGEATKLSEALVWRMKKLTAQGQ